MSVSTKLSSWNFHICGHMFTDSLNPNIQTVFSFQTWTATDIIAVRSRPRIPGRRTSKELLKGGAAVLWVRCLSISYFCLEILSPATTAHGVQCHNQRGQVDGWGPPALVVLPPQYQQDELLRHPRLGREAHVRGSLPHPEGWDSERPKTQLVSMLTPMSTSCLRSSAQTLFWMGYFVKLGNSWETYL